MTNNEKDFSKNDLYFLYEIEEEGKPEEEPEKLINQDIINLFKSKDINIQSNNESNRNEDNLNDNNLGNKEFLRFLEQISLETQKNISSNTGHTSTNFLTHKIEREEEKNGQNEENGNNKDQEEKKENIEKKKDKINKGKKVHDKKAEDNKIRKIKTNIFKYILLKLNNSLSNKISRFNRLDKKLNEEIKKDYNENLLNMELYKIYSNPLFQHRIKRINNPNQLLIEKIYKEKKEKDTIKLLDMKFSEILDYIREKDIDKYLNDIREKELKKNNVEDIDSYIEEIKGLLLNYEKWFEKKIPKKPKKNNLK